MRDIIIRIIKNIIVYTISILATIGIVFAISWPTGSPTGETVSGVFYDSLKSIIGRTEYSLNCNDYILKGWTNKNDCLHDGRWHKVFTNNINGTVANNDLKNAIKNGADLKVVSGDKGYVETLGVWIDIGYNEQYCEGVILESSGHVICVGGTTYSGETSDTVLKGTSGNKKNIGASILKTTGIFSCVSIYSDVDGGSTKKSSGGCGPYIRVSADWYIKY